jgi:hypothetical protein
MLLVLRGVRPTDPRYDDALVGALLENESLMHLRAMSGHEMHITFLNEEDEGAEGTGSGDG